MTRGYEVVADALVGADVTDLFGVMGEGNLELITHLQGSRGVRYHAARHENGAIAAAHGYAQASGGLGVATVTHGPGMTHGMTSLVSAARLGVPLLLVVGDVASDSDGHVQAIDHLALARAAGVVVEHPTSAATLGKLTARAIAGAVTGDAAVLLLVPVNVLESPCDGPSPEPPADPRQAGAADGDDVRRAATVLEGADRPVVLAGFGAARAGARDRLVALGERIGAELATTLRAKSLFDGHPLNVGVVGPYGHPLSAEPARDADVLAAFGASLNPFTISAGTAFTGATVIHCDVSAASIGHTTAVDVALVGDARTVAGRLVELVGEDPRRRREREVRISAFEPPVGKLAAPFDPAVLCVALEGALPGGRTLVCDAGAFTEYPMKWIRVPEPRAFVFAQGFGAVGLGIGTATGAQAARPDRPTVCFVGDGGFMASLPDLETACRLRIPMVVVVMDDGAYGAEIHHLRHRGLPLDAATFENPSPVDLARAMGGDGMELVDGATIAELASRLEQPLDRPFVVHAPIDGGAISPWFGATVEGAARFVTDR